MPGMGWMYITSMRSIGISHPAGRLSVDKDVRGTGNKRNRGAGIMPCVLISHTCRLTH